MRWFKPLPLVVALALVTITPAAASPGALDPDFDGDGRAVMDVLASPSEGGTAIAAQPDGKIVVGVDDGGDTAAVVRSTTDGSPDPLFGGGDGIVPLPSLGSIADVVVDPSGGIVVVGQAFPGDTYGDIGVVRLLEDGTPDPAFHGGSVVLSLEYGQIASRVAVLPDGSLIVAGTTTIISDDLFFVAAIRTDGKLRRSFNADGLRQLKMSAGGRAKGLAIQPDGSILLAGPVLRPNDQYDYGVARLTPTGALDTTFGDRGRTFVDVGSNDQATSMALRGDGKIFVAGYAYTPTGYSSMVIRLTSVGAPDPFFGSGGIAIHSMAKGEERTNAITLQGETIVVAGSCSSTAGASDICVMRLLTHGQLDDTFDGDGRVRTDFNGGEDYGFDTALASDGKILVTGWITSNGYKTGVVRYLSA